MCGEVLTLQLQLDAGAEADAQEVDLLTTRLRQQLLDLDVQSVDRVRAGEAPDGTRAAGALLVGGLLVTLSKSPELMKTIVGLVQSWLAARQGRSIEMQISGDVLKVTGIGSDEQHRLIELFVERHTR